MCICQFLIYSPCTHDEVQQSVSFSSQLTWVAVSASWISCSSLAEPSNWEANSCKPFSFFVGLRMSMDPTTISKIPSPMLRPAQTPVKALAPVEPALIRVRPPIFRLSADVSRANTLLAPISAFTAVLMNCMRRPVCFITLALSNIVYLATMAPLVVTLRPSRQAFVLLIPTAAFISGGPQWWLVAEGWLKCILRVDVLPVLFCDASVLSWHASATDSASFLPSSVFKYS